MCPAKTLPPPPLTLPWAAAGLAVVSQLWSHGQGQPARWVESQDGGYRNEQSYHTFLPTQAFFFKGTCHLPGVSPGSMVSVGAVKPLS